MSKKHKKQSRKVSAAPITNNPAAGVSARNGAKSGEADFKPDYKQTIKDLKRIGILAGTFFTILIILSFFLR